MLGERDKIEIGELRKFEWMGVGVQNHLNEIILYD
jgi:hypothetical protein